MHIPGRRLNSGEDVITSPFPRGGDGMFLRAQLIAKEGADPGDTTVKVYTRNSEDSWPALTSPIATMTIDGTDTEGTLFELHVPSDAGSSGIKEELRMQVDNAGTGWVLIRIFPPVFYDAAIGSL